MSFFDKNPLWLALLIQFSVFLLMSLSLPIISRWIIPPYDVEWMVFVQSICAVVISFIARMPRWWLWIQAVFPIALIVGLTQTLIPAVWFGIFGFVLLFVFSNVWIERVPLYLSNRLTHRALIQLAGEYGVKRALDLGSGLGGVVRALAESGIDAVGVEFSPVLAFISNQLCRWFGWGRVVQGDMWQCDISDYDLVYVFLSPVPMNDIWQKAQKEMRQGAILVSNSFAIEGVEPDDVWVLSDGRQTELFIYVMK